jgi:hypothetical protein
MRFKPVAVPLFAFLSATIAYSAKAAVVVDNPLTFELTINTLQVLTDPTVVLFDGGIPTETFDLGEFAPPGTYKAIFSEDLGFSTTYSFLSLYGENLLPNPPVAAAFPAPVAANLIGQSFSLAFPNSTFSETDVGNALLNQSVTTVLAFASQNLLANSVPFGTSLELVGFTNGQNIGSLTVSVVPEPQSSTLLAAGLMLLLLLSGILHRQHVVDEASGEKACPPEVCWYRHHSR